MTGASAVFVGAKQRGRNDKRRNCVKKKKDTGACCWCLSLFFFQQLARSRSWALLDDERRGRKSSLNLVKKPRAAPVKLPCQRSCVPRQQQTPLLDTLLFALWHAAPSRDETRPMPRRPTFQARGLFDFER